MFSAALLIRLQSEVKSGVISRLRVRSPAPAKTSGRWFGNKESLSSQWLQRRRWKSKHLRSGCYIQWLSLHHQTGLFCVPSCRKGVVRRVSAIGLAWALATTLLHTGDLRSPRASAQTLGATLQQAWRSNTSSRDRSEPSGTCSTRTGPTTAAPRTLKVFSVSTTQIQAFLYAKPYCFWHSRKNKDISVWTNCSGFVNQKEKCKCSLKNSLSCYCKKCCCGWFCILQQRWEHNSCI